MNGDLIMLNRIEELMKDTTRQELAERMDTTVQQVDNILEAEDLQHISIGTLVKVAKALNTRIDNLYVYGGDKIYNDTELTKEKLEGYVKTYGEIELEIRKDNPDFHIKSIWEIASKDYQDKAKKHTHNDSNEAYWEYFINQVNKVQRRGYNINKEG